MRIDQHVSFTPEVTQLANGWDSGSTGMHRSPPMMTSSISGLPHLSRSGFMRGPCSPGAWEASGRGLQAQAVYRNHGPHPWLPNVYLSKRHLPTKVHLVKAMVFPVVMHGCESWTIKKAEGRRIDAFELWCWKRLLRVPWTAKRSNQSFQWIFMVNFLQD